MPVPPLIPICVAHHVTDHDLYTDRYTESGDDVTVKFQHREGDGPGESEWTAKVVIGADGAFSPVRRQCLDDGSPRLAVTLTITPHRSCHTAV